MRRPKVPRHERALSRVRVGPLKATLVKAGTMLVYRKSVHVFFLWCVTMKISWPSDGDELDHVVSQFGEMAWEEGETRALFANLLSGLPLYEESLRQYLNCSRRLLTAWDKNEWTVRSFPLTPDMTFAMVGLAVSLDWLVEATALLVGYDGLLRIMELLRLRAGDIKGGLESPSLILELHDTKTSSRKSVLERAVLTCPYACALLLALKSDLQPGEFVFKELSAKIMRSRMRALADKLNLSDLYITPHSLRRGKATELFKVSNSFDVVAQAGRWEQLRTCRKYVDQAVAEMSRFSCSNVELLKASRKPLDLLFS